MEKTGVKATVEEMANIQELAKIAQTTPVIALSSADALSGNDFSSRAWKCVYEAINAAAEEHGLSKVKGGYGLAIEEADDGEFVFEEPSS